MVASGDFRHVMPLDGECCRGADLLCVATHTFHDLRYDARIIATHSSIEPVVTLLPGSTFPDAQTVRETTSYPSAKICGILLLA